MWIEMLLQMGLEEGLKLGSGMRLCGLGLQAYRHRHLQSRRLHLNRRMVDRQLRVLFDSSFGWLLPFWLWLLHGVVRE